MDDTPASPASSDSDAYNTEDARLYFGPLKTPERNFVAASQSRLFPTASNPLLRRSPRLSSPRPRSTVSTDVRTTEEDMMDIDQVAQLVKAVSDEEEEEAMDSGSATPQEVNLLPDEPSSALADKIMHALDNPSPPPSPPLLLSMFDPYHTTVADPSNDYQTDLMSLKISQGPGYDETSPSAPSATIAPTASISPSAAIPPPANNPAETQEDLIHFNSFSTPPPENTTHLGSIHHPQLLSVDDFLSQSPANLSGSQIQGDVRDVVITPLENIPPQLSPNQSLGPGFSNETGASTVVVPEIIVGLPDDDSEQCLSSLTLAEAQPISGTFLRRSTRPRRSVTPSLPMPPTPSVPTAPPSPARTQVKKKALNSDLAENVASGSRASMLEGSQASHPTSLTTIRVRHRSPGKGPLSFQRELGSLSPTSANLLSGLGFIASDSDNGDLLANQEEVSACAQPMFSSSTFSPPTDSTGPSTPNRSSGPVRLSSPVKGTSSPNKFRIQTPAPNDPKNTPARRIPIAEAIVQGHVSPEKAIQMGFRPNGTPLTSTPTPARRVLVSNLASHPPPKSNTLRFGKPVKREASSEPRQQPGSLDKGKGKEVQIPSEPSTAQTKLPFPLVPSAPAPIGVPASSTSDAITKAKVSPVRSGLKQVTSRIPRIGVKPYSRLDKPKPAGGNANGASAPRMGGTKAESVPNVRRATPVTSSVSGMASRTSAPQSGSTTLLKRKREAASPVKPRVVLLRQVPQVVITPTDPLPKPPNIPIISAAAKKKQAASQGPMRIRRVMDPEPSVSAAVQLPFPHFNQATEPLGIPTAENKPVQESSALREPLLPSKAQDEVSSGSPMKQDLNLPILPELIPEKQQSFKVTASAPIPSTVLPENHNIALSSSSTSDLRRTTRSRRTAIAQDVFGNPPPPRPSSRRKPPAFHSDDIFSGMSLTALKDLTISNTVRNQRYLAAKLETEVVRREGVRPDSPAVKVRTMVQKQQEEKDRQRAERANRRARRSGDMGSSDIEGFFSDAGYSSPCEDINMADGAEPLPKHQRGAGEDDDYETPERHHRHKKRTRLFDDIDIMDTSESESTEPKRRVKWDRGLFTTVYIDEVKLGSRETLKENRSLKGILAPTAKALRLDTLGNLPHADSPLVDLVQENITVKKIVYDSDVPPLPAEVAVKNTRSKNKKK